MAVYLNTKSTNTYFNILAPGNLSGQDEAMFIGDAGGSRYEGMLPMTGDHIIQANLCRNAARRSKSAHFMRDVDTAAAGGSGGGNAGNAKVAGTQFNAMDRPACARAAGQPAAT
jgi:hypothetical protein